MEQQNSSLPNTPVYVTANALMDKGGNLGEAVQIALQAGVDGFEIRRELLPRTLEPGQIEQIRSLLQPFGVSPVYSIPLPLFWKGTFKPEPIQAALLEARDLGCTLVKFSPLGLGNEAGTSQLQTLREFLENTAEGIKVTVENGQDAESGNLESWENFFRAAYEQECPVGMTFDLGNWLCFGINPLEAAKRLGKYVAYLHAKSVERQADGSFVSKPIQQSPATNEVFTSLPAYVPRAIEFPIQGTSATGKSHTLKAYSILLRSGNFTV